MSGADVSRIERVILRGDATSADVHRAAAGVMQRGEASLWVGGVWVARVAAMLRGSGVAVCGVVAYPQGISKSTVKAIEATAAVKDGAGEIAVVPHLPDVLRADVDASKRELMEIVRAARSARSDVVVKVILDVARFSAAPLDYAALFEVTCRAARESGCDALVLGDAAPADRIERLRLALAHAQGLSVIAMAADARSAEGLLAAGADRVALWAAED